MVECEIVNLKVVGSNPIGSVNQDNNIMSV